MLIKKEETKCPQECAAEGMTMSQTLKASPPSAPVFRSPQQQCVPYADRTQLVTFDPSLASGFRGATPGRPHHHHPGDQQGNPCFPVEFRPKSSEGNISVPLFRSSLPPFLSYPSRPSFQPSLISLGLRVRSDLPSFTRSLPDLSLSLVAFWPVSSKGGREELNPFAR